MTKFYLIRHASYDGLEQILAGRQPGLHLSAAGRREVEALAQWLAPVHFAAIHTSPLERTVETAKILGRNFNLEALVAEELLEIDYGEWTAALFENLERNETWRRFNAFRSSVRVPGGESMMEVQARVVTKLVQLAEIYEDQTIGVVTHGDLIRAATAHFAGIHLDLMLRLRIDPCSFSVLKVNKFGPEIISMNNRAEI
ncbi:MAG: histidine phosphatase family protein [Pyrinomonadaceae bacterium]